jgi:hypothetical protein
MFLKRDSVQLHGTPALHYEVEAPKSSTLPGLVDQPVARTSGLLAVCLPTRYIK